MTGCISKNGVKRFSEGWPQECGMAAVYCYSTERGLEAWKSVCNCRLAKCEKSMHKLHYYCSSSKNERECNSNSKRMKKSVCPKAERVKECLLACHSMYTRVSSYTTENESFGCNCSMIDWIQNGVMVTSSKKEWMNVEWNPGCHCCHLLWM